MVSTVLKSGDGFLSKERKPSPLFNTVKGGGGGCGVHSTEEW